MNKKSLNLCLLSFPFNIQKYFSISNNGELFPVSYFRSFFIKVGSKNRQTSLFISSLNDNERELIRSDIAIAYLFICAATKTSKNVWWIQQKEVINETKDNIFCRSVCKTPDFLA